MTDIQQMQGSLDRAITRIDELEERIHEIMNDPSAILELKESKRILAIQQRVKITLIQSIQELTPTSNTLIIPEKLSNSIISRVSNFFKKLFN
uniref:Uncharacterized protein n=1 Tax=viral metagenome TaxID=1070528 RepID=A0A6C0AMI2_9ZZZZ